MRLRFAIPLTIVLLAATSYLSGILSFNAYYALVGATAIWGAYDSHRLQVERFDSSLALPPIGVLIALAVLWPFTFPSYLKLRYRIQHGEIGPRLNRTFRLRWLIVGGIAAAAISALVLLWRSPTIRGLASLATDVSAEFQVPVTVSLSDGRYLGLKIQNAPPPADSVLLEWEKCIARFAWDRYSRTGSLDSVSVTLVDSRQQGAVTITSQHDRNAWAVEELRDSPPAPEDDVFARSFIENVRTQNVAGAAQLEPGGVINWKDLGGIGQLLPKGNPQLIRPIRWVLFVGRAGVTRKLTYSIEAPSDTGLAEVWLSHTGGHTYVNTFRVTPAKK